MLPVTFSSSNKKNLAHNYLDSDPTMWYLGCDCFSFLRKLMKRKRHHTLALSISLLMILALSLGTSFGGISVCPPDCAESKVIFSCCAGMEGNEMSGTEGSPQPLSPSNNCDHEGICIDGFQTISISAVNFSIQYYSFPAPSPQGFSIKPNLYKRVGIPILQKQSSENFPSLFLRNCSFLI